MSKERVQQQITAKQLFDEKSFLGLGVAEEFAKSRWEVKDGVVKLRNEGEAGFYNNAGAIEITSRGTVYGANGFSDGALFRLPSFKDRAHTERRLMYDALEKLIPEDFSEDGIRRPSQMAKVPKKINEHRQQERLNLSSVTDNASTFKRYLDRTESVVKMFSERIPCNKCSNFLDNILPETEGTAVGYFTEKTGEAGNREVERFTDHMIKAYQDYININTNWASTDNLGNTSSYSYSESSSEEIFKRRRSHHHHTASSTDS